MGRLIAAEWHKLMTTKLWLLLLLAAMALTALYASLAIVFATEPDNPTPPLSSLAGQRTVFSLGAGGASALAAVLGALGMTGEFRHNTASATFLAIPHRGRVILAKLVAYLFAGAGYGLVCFAVSVAVAVPWLATKGIAVRLAAIGGTIGGVVAAVAIFALIGVGLGALLRNQVATVVALLIYLFVVENAITRIPSLGDWTSYLPGTARNALTGVSQSNLALLAPWQGGLVLVGYGTVLALAATLFSIRRDIA